MSKVVELTLEEGDFETGFPVILDISDDSLGNHKGRIRIRASLPPGSIVASNYTQWQEIYQKLETKYRRAPVVIPDNPASPEECRELFENLKNSINNWLKSNEFRPIEQELFRSLNSSDEIRVIVRTAHPKLRKLPWESWDFFEHFDNAAVAISPLDHRLPETTPNRNSIVKILAIFGSSTDINIDKDRELLEKLRQAGAYVRILKSPKRPDFETLWDENWDILFFAGHSYSHNDDKGFIYINENEKVALSELKHTLRKVIKDGGLQLAIFNSCDGLGIATEMEKLHIPQMIVMREPVPDQFAQEFLRYFLKPFSQGKSLYASVREARQKLSELSDIESKFPGVSLLPIICQNPVAKPVTWEGFKKPPQKIPKWKIAMAGLMVSAISLSLIYWWLLERPICSFSDFRTKLFINIPQKQQFNYGGSTSWIPIASPVDSAIKKTIPEFDLQYISPPSSGGSVWGIGELLQGNLAFSQSSRPPKDDERQKALAQGFPLDSVAIGIDAVVVAVNRGLNIPGLTKAQLKGIYTGKIRNWQEVGGPNLPIIPYSRSLEESGTVQYFYVDVLEREPLNPQVVQFVKTTTIGLQQVTNNLGGIYFASASEVVPQCRIRPLPLARQQDNFIAPYRGNLVPPQLCGNQNRNQINIAAFEKGDYPLTRNLFVIIKDFPGESNPEEKAGRAYANLMLTGKGQAIIEEAGFVPTRNACR
ncbi:substrate-binding domain-containing protein [Tolypothrix sp. FACHB-123]|uniref:substrate-binding domain-containing protein n=1 Tax=Tolypothrix sp. FACHB-123 TaxID=2692868 RepID=UPI001684B50B|nr:substrate-binding domain-containing protein [Tolypothrix sp. FACHB-123]MBD2358574.1 substrate-binding domain-containing protein [Tolypothrix sp. FACHB-123]